MTAQAVRAMNSPKSGSTQNRTIFHEILDSKLPPEEKTIARLGDEASVTLAAGTLTTSWTLSVALYYLLTTPSVLQKLKTELEKGMYPFSLRISQMTDFGIHHSYPRHLHVYTSGPTRGSTLSRSLRPRSHPAGLRRIRTHLNHRTRRNHGPLQPSHHHPIHHPTRHTNKHDNHAAAPRRAHLPLLPNLPSRTLAREPASR